MQILLINNDGGGFADYIELADGTTVSQLFDARIGGKPRDYLIRVNRHSVAHDQALQSGDRVSITPVRSKARIAKPAPQRRRTPGNRLAACGLGASIQGAVTDGREQDLPAADCEAHGSG
jgi:sulfur carrier protein ThiS